MHEWIAQLGLLDEFALAPLLDAGAELEQINLAELRTNDALREIFGAGREALNFVASHVSVGRGNTSVARSAGPVAVVAIGAAVRRLSVRSTARLSVAESPVNAIV